MSVGRIVIIEDNPADVLLVKEALKHHGVACDLEQYSNGEDAVKAIAAMQHAPALFLVDLNIPRLHGFDVLRVIRSCSILDEAPTAILTSSRAPDDKAESERLGADAYIVKSSGYHEFLTNVGGTIVQLLQRKLPGAQGRASKYNSRPVTGRALRMRTRNKNRASDRL